MNMLWYKKVCRLSIMVLAVITMAVSCAVDKDDEDISGKYDHLYESARITDTPLWPKFPDLTCFNFIYPSVDPYGNPAMLSGTITMGPEVTPGVKATGLILYNHFSIYMNEECPTSGNLTVQDMVNIRIPGSGFITVSPDFWGFGSTSDKHQAYCIGSANARAAVDALLAAKKILREKGYVWDDSRLLNVGYSQGGQTAIAVSKLLDTSYPDINVTCTFAGAGPYDIPETYRVYLNTDFTDTPSNVVNVLLAFNEYYSLNIPLSNIFKEPLLSNVDEWMYSKKYGRSVVDGYIGSSKLSDIMTPDVMNPESEVYRMLLEAMEKENLCNGWTPRHDKDYFLVHNTIDGTVPVENTIKLIQFMEQQGVTDVETVVENMGSIPGVLSTHDVGSLYLISGIKDWYKREKSGF